MSQPTPPAGATPPSFTDAELIGSIKSVFSDKLKANNAIHREELYHSFANLAGIYVMENCPALIGELYFDYAGVKAMFARFQRDAFGVGNFHDFIQELVVEKEITPLGAGRVIRQLPGLGIRINTDSPRKTKIAAAFSLWMSVFRPVQLKKMFYSGVSAEQHIAFCGSLNFWMASMYLAMFGKVVLNDDRDGQTLTVRIKHDLTYRALNLSSLELLYASVYRPLIS